MQLPLVSRRESQNAELAGLRESLRTTPKHGSWLNIAEIELSRLTRQCLDRRLDDLDLLNTELAAWQAATNADQRQVDWQFTTADARIKLRHHTRSIRCDALLAVVPLVGRRFRAENGCVAAR